jgi:hypothetical protein
MRWYRSETNTVITNLCQPLRAGLALRKMETLEPAWLHGRLGGCRLLAQNLMAKWASMAKGDWLEKYMQHAELGPVRSNHGSQLWIAILISMDLCYSFDVFQTVYIFFLINSAFLFSRYPFYNWLCYGWAWKVRTKISCGFEVCLSLWVCFWHISLFRVGCRAIVIHY